MHPCLKGNLQETCARTFSFLVLLLVPTHFAGFARAVRCTHIYIHTLTCTLHAYKPTVHPAASRRLFFDVQVITLLLGEYTSFAHANLYYPTTRLRSYFSTIFAVHLHVYTRMLGCKRSFTTCLQLVSFKENHNTKLGALSIN